MSGIATAINSASGNPGVTATVIQGTDGAHLLLSSSQTGESNTIQMSETDSGSALSALTYSSSNTANYAPAVGRPGRQIQHRGCGGDEHQQYDR